MQVANAAHDMLSMIDIGAAQLNDKINLFRDEAKFPEVFRSGSRSSTHQLFIYGLARRVTLAAFCTSVVQTLEHQQLNNSARKTLCVPLQHATPMAA